jgi:hypothetical protein
MGFERDLEMYIKSTDWDIDYKNGKVTNILGQEIDVKVEKAEGCMDFLGKFNAGQRQIWIREACDGYTDPLVASSEVELAAYTLAHELGHADSYLPTYLVSAAILSFGIAEAVRKRSLRPFAYASIGFIATQIFLNEILADTCASAFHNVPFMGAAYQLMPEFFDNMGGLF